MRISSISPLTARCRALSQAPLSSLSAFSAVCDDQTSPPLIHALLNRATRTFSLAIEKSIAHANEAFSSSIFSSKLSILISKPFFA